MLHPSPNSNVERAAITPFWSGQDRSRVPACILDGTGAGLAANPKPVLLVSCLVPACNAEVASASEWLPLLEEVAEVLEQRRREIWGAETGVRVTSGIGVEHFNGATLMCLRDCMLRSRSRYILILLENWVADRWLALL